MSTAAALCLMMQLALGTVAHDAAGARSQQARPPATRPTGTANITVYRVSPSNYTGLTNMNSGDAGGDIAFGLWSLMFPMMCRSGGDDDNIGCPSGTGRYIEQGEIQAPARW